MQLRQLLGLIIVVVCQSATAKVDTPLTPDSVVGEYLVKADAAPLKAALDSSGFQYVEELPFGFHLVRDRESRESASASQKLAELGASESQPNFIRRIATAAIADQWALDNPKTGADIRAPAAWSHLKTIPGSDRTIRVAVIDTGIDKEAKEFAGRIDFKSSYNFIGNNNDIQDFNGHGSHVAGVIGASHSANARIRGVNPNVEFVILKAFTMYGFATSGSVLKALNAALKANVKVINASYGTTSFDKAEFEALKKVRAAGILFVAAAGNDGKDTDKSIYYPAGYDLPNIVSVGASTKLDQPASYSNFGETSVDVFAPGSDIVSTVVDVDFVNPKKVYELDMQDTSASEWKSRSATNVGLVASPWAFVSCGDVAGSCLRFKPTSDYEPSAKFDFFNYVHLRDSIPSNREKRFTAVINTKYTIPQIDWNHRTTGSVMAGADENWVLPASYKNGKTNGWTTERHDISEPGVFYSGTTAWNEFILGFSLNFSNMKGHSEYKSTEMMIKKITLETEDPVSRPALANYNGTSMATPHVAGIATWIFALDPKVAPDDVRKKLIASCDAVASMKTKAVCGGRVNLNAAVRP